MKRLLHFSLSALTLCLLSACAPNPYASLEQTLALAKSRAYFSRNVDWATVEPEARSIATHPAIGEDGAIRFVLQSLKDRHSFLQPKTTQPPQYVASNEPNRRMKPIAQFEGVEAGVGVLSVNGWTGDGNASTSAALLVRTTLLEALTKNECGVIVDFSANIGGNMWPMVVGLAPLLTDGNLGFFRDSKDQDAVIAKSGDSVTISGSQQVPASTALPQTRASIRKVAIILGPASASSGEIVPILFASQGNTRTFGKPTRGIHSANEMFTLPNGGMLALTTAVTLDRNKKVIDGPIRPNVESETPRVDAANWVLSGCK